MSSVETQRVYVCSADGERWEPYMLEGQAFGEVQLLRTEGADSLLVAGRWRCEPSTRALVHAEDETLIVLAGRAEIRMEDGETVLLGQGDSASFVKGQPATWTITEPFEKFFVVSGKAVEDGQAPPS